MDGISGIDINAKISKADLTYKIDNITSEIWGLAPFMQWDQKDFSTNKTGNIIRVEVLGYLSMNLVVEDFGKIFSMRITFIVDINDKTGEFVAAKVKSN